MINWFFGNNEQSELDKKLDAIEEKIDKKIAELEELQHQLVRENTEKLEQIKDLHSRINDLKKDE